LNQIKATEQNIKNDVKQDISQGLGNMNLGGQNQIYFMPDPNCAKCSGYGKLKSGGMCTLCSEKNRIGGNELLNLQQQGKSFFYPNPSCKTCSGTGYRTGSKDLCSTCKTSNYIPQGGLGQGIGQHHNLSNQGSLLTQPGSFGSQNEQLGFVANPKCLDCRGSGMQTGNKDFCLTCYPMNQRSGLLQGGSYQQGSFQGGLPFTARSDCLLCKGAGYKTGTQDFCIECYPMHQRKSFNQGQYFQGGLPFTPKTSCLLCKGLGYKSGTQEFCIECYQ